MGNQVVRTPWTQALVAELTGRDGGLLPGEELWHNRNVHNVQRFRAMVADAERRGEIRRITDVIEKKYAAYVVVVRMKPRTKRWPWFAAGAAVVLSWVMSVAIWLYTYRSVVLLAVVGGGSFLVTWWLLTRFNHRGACPGLHCAGCR